jgi:hypothetical protein
MNALAWDWMTRSRPSPLLNGILIMAFSLVRRDADSIVVCDGNYVSARWPGDVNSFA